MHISISGTESDLLGHHRIVLRHLRNKESARESTMYASNNLVNVINIILITEASTEKAALKESTSLSMEQKERIAAIMTVQHMSSEKSASKGECRQSQMAKEMMTHKGLVQHPTNQVRKVQNGLYLSPTLGSEPMCSTVAK